jgi:hypothetical protein
MKVYSAWLGVAMALSIGMGVAAYASTVNDAQAVTKPNTVVLAQSNAQCQQEAAQLNAQLSQCTTNEYRQQVQAAIAAHNA